MLAMIALKDVIGSEQGVAACPRHALVLLLLAASAPSWGIAHLEIYAGTAAAVYASQAHPGFSKSSTLQAVQHDGNSRPRSVSKLTKHWDSS